MNLAQIKLELLSFRGNPEFPTDQAYEYAAHLLRQAYEIALANGVDWKPVKRLCSPSQALLEVNKLITASRDLAASRVAPTSQPSEFLNVPQAAKLLGVGQSKIAEFIKADRLEATNVGQRGKRPQWRIHPDALQRIKPETYQPSRKHKPPQEII